MVVVTYYYKGYKYKAMHYMGVVVVVVVVVVSHIQRIIIGCQPDKKKIYTVANPARGLLNREK